MCKMNLRSFLDYKLRKLNKLFSNNNKIRLKAVMVIVVLLIAVFFSILNGEKSHIKKEDFFSNSTNTVVSDIENNNKSDMGKTTEKQAKDKKEEEYVFIDIDGQVKNPGVYQIKKNERIIAAIEAAGGLTEIADVSQINRAIKLTDEMKIYIPSKEEIQVNSETNTDNPASSKISINKASKNDFENIPGIGPKIAERIVEYRLEKGSFNSVEDLKNVKGIGDKMFEKIKSYISL